MRDRKTVPPQALNENELLDLAFTSIINTLLYTPLPIEPSYHSINLAYNPEEEFHQRSKHDIFLFTTNDKLIKTLPLQIYTSDLEEGREYPAVIGSFGSSFDNQFSTYDPSIYTESELLLRYKDGLFYRPLETMDFAFRFHKKKNGKLGWNCFPLSPQGTFAASEGDSGAVALTEDNKALAIHIGLDYEEFYKGNQELAGLLNNLRRETDVQYSTETIEQLVDHIERRVSSESPPRKLDLGGNTVMYGFTLNQSFSPIRWSEYYMPLSPHRKFIEEFIQTIGLLGGEAI